MKHYRIVKKSTYFLIAISAFAVFFSLALFGADKLNLIKVNLPGKIAADVITCDSGENVNINIVPMPTTSPTKVPINTIFTVQINSFDAPGQLYRYQFYILDVKSGTVPYTSSIAEGLLGKTTDSIGRPTWSVGENHYNLNTVGEKRIYVKYSQKQGDNWCTDWKKSNEISILAVDNTVDSANVTLTLPEKGELSTPFTAQINIKDGIGYKYEMYLSGGGDCPSKPDDVSCWPRVAMSDIDVEDYTSTSSIIPPDTGKVAVKAKVFNIDTGEMTDMKIAYITICPVGTMDTCVADNSPPGDTPGAGEVDPIETPPKIDQFSKFTSSFVMPIDKIKGAGDFTMVIIYLISYLAGAFAFIGIAISGIQYISSGGDPTKAEKAKKNLIYCVIGIVLAVLALVIQAIAVTFWGGPK